MAGVVAATVAFAAASAGASTDAKAFPVGCWIGKSAYNGTYAAGPVKAKIANGKQTFALWVVSAKPTPHAVGFLTVTGAGAGTLTISGSTLSLKVKILGDYDLTGTPSAVKVNGTYSMTGTAHGTGQFLPSVPVKLKFPVKNAPLTIQTVTPQKVTGVFGKAPWSATLRAGPPSKSAAACAAAGK